MAAPLQWFLEPFSIFLADNNGVLLNAQPASNQQYTIQGNVVWPGSFPVQGGINFTFQVTATGSAPAPVGGPSYSSLKAAYDACQTSWNTVTGSPLQWFPEPLEALIKDPPYSVLLSSLPAANIQYVIYPYVTNYPGPFPVQGGPPSLQFYVISIGTRTSMSGQFSTLKAAYDACQADWNAN